MFYPVRLVNQHYGEYVILQHSPVSLSFITLHRTSQKRSIVVEVSGAFMKTPTNPTIMAQIPQGCKSFENFDEKFALKIFCVIAHEAAYAALAIAADVCAACM